MNKTYRLIWSKIKEAWIIVSENVQGNGGPAPVTVGAALVVASLAVCSGVATALPTGAQIVNGTAGIVTNGSTMTVTNSANAIINWQGFSIGSSETTRFIQPSAVSAVLNRVTGGNPSQILGTLQSNGKVLLINPSGIIFGAGARVDVGGLIASSLDIANQDFLAGRMKFTAGAMAGKVENQGAITTPSGGQVYLIAPDVTNSGVITAPNGDVLLAAGKEVLLVDSSNPEIALVVTAPDGQALNLGTTVADAGRVGMYGSIVRHQGRISADSAVQDASGRIFFKATKEVTLDSGSITTANGSTGGTVITQATEGTTLVSGTIEAKGSSGNGGTVQVLGKYAGLIDNATIDTSGTNGGGTVLVGGDYQGKNIDIQNAEATYMGKDTVIKADATNTGNGGKVILWSDNTTRAYGSIFARGGANGGDGGFVETSGHYLSIDGIEVSTFAKYGKSGTWLLDPTNIWIATDTASATSAAGYSVTDTSVDASQPPLFQSALEVNDSFLDTATLQSALANSNVTVNTTNSSGGGSGNITLVDLLTGLSNMGGKTLTLTADNNIAINAAISGSTVAPAIIMNAGGAISVTGNITVDNALAMTGTNITLGGNIQASRLDLQADQNVQVNGSITTSGYVNINAISGGAISGTGLITSPTINLQNFSGTSSVGIAGTPLLTSGTSNINFGMSGNGPSAVYMSHTGAATLGNLGADAPFSFLSSGNLSVSTSISTGTSDLTLTSTGGALTTSGMLSGNNIFLTAGGDFTATGIISASNNLSIDLTGAGSKFTRGGTNVDVGGTVSTTIKADKIDNSATGGILGAAGSLVTLMPKTGGTSITLGSDNTDTDLNITANELNQVTAATLRIGGNQSGAVNVGAAIAPTNVTNLVLGSGSTVGQSGAGTISIASLGVKSLGTADLSTVTNLVTGNIAAALGDGSHLNSNFKFKNSGGFNVGTVDGIAGVSTQISGVYNSGSPDGVISLTSGGAITQSALLAGKALKAVGSAVTLTGSNPMGVISGSASSGGFSYNSTNSIALDTVDGLVGVTATSGDVSLVASGTSSDISVFEGGSIQGLNVTLNAGRDLVVTGGTVLSTDNAGSTTVVAGRDVKVNGGFTDSGEIKAYNDVNITATTGKLYLTSNGTTSAAKVEANANYTVYLNFPGQTSGGYVIDGDSSGTVISGSNSNTGIFVMGSPAVVGSTLQTAYAAPPPPPPPPVPTLDACIANPVLSGCSTVLPTLDTCTTAPTTPGCSVVLPTIDACTATPTAPGCTAVLPSLTTCTTTPTLPGCSAVLPTLTACTVTPALPGCSVVLPSLATCTSSPSTAGCSVVLPSLTSCTTTPSLPGCSVVLPNLTSCITTPSLPGCSVVLPALSACTATPSLPGCSVVLPSLTSCITTPSLTGCSVVLPTLTTCTAIPSLPGCSVVLPTVSTCLETPSAPGCLVVVPQHEQQGLTGGSGTVINALAQIPTTPVAPAGLQLVGLVPPGTPPPADGENDDKKNGAGNNNQGGEPPAGDNKNDKARKMYCN